MNPFVTVKMMNGTEFTVNINNICFVKHKPDSTSVCVAMLNGSNLRMHPKEYAQIKEFIDNMIVKGISSL
jgi:uncharacterized protein YlzI (FlbEa/FlbD family)